LQCNRLFQLASVPKSLQGDVLFLCCPF
jgi:hypothetical protein